MSNIVIITAKGRNKSIRDKNIIKIANKPCIVYGIKAAKESELVDDVFVLTDDPKIKKVASKYSCKVIDEPKKFTSPNANHGDAIAYGIKEVKERFCPDLEIVTILLGNTVATNTYLINLAIKILNKKRSIDSVMSVWQAQDDHPFRALQKDKKGFLTSFLNIKSGTSRQFYPKIYFYDQGIWTFRYKNLYKKEGPNPWWWMGKRCFPIVRNWVTGRDTHTKLDLDYSKYWIKNKHLDEIINQREIDKLIQDK